MKHPPRNCCIALAGIACISNTPAALERSASDRNANILSTAGRTSVAARLAYTICEQMPRRGRYRFEQNITVLLPKTEDAKRAFAKKRKQVFKRN